MTKTKILVLVEGRRLDAHVMKMLINMYGLSERHEIIPYETNIYTLYSAMFKEGKPDEYDLLQILKEKEKDENLKCIFDINYSDILLVFDLDPQDPLFENDKITRMLEYFNESTDKGKLYLNYPMIEAFYHMKNIPDEKYVEYTASLDVLKRKLYKQIVHQMVRETKLDNIQFTLEECNSIIKSNLYKANTITGKDEGINRPEDLEILNKQLMLLDTEKKVYVLSTCPFYIIDYNPKLLNVVPVNIGIKHQVY